MTLHTLFGTNVTKPQKIQLKQIKAVYEVSEPDPINSVCLHNNRKYGNT